MPDPTFRVGVDDAGRGALAGPLIVCALTHPEPNALLRLGARDSKTTTPADRLAFLAALAADGRARWVVSAAEPDWIDKTGHATATNIATRSAIDDLWQLHLQGTRLNQLEFLVDGLAVVPNLPRGSQVRYIPGGDALEPLIGAASMVAGHFYDQAVAKLHTQFPQFDFASHHGYSTEAHRQRLFDLGPTPFHRHRPTLTAMETHSRKTGCAMPLWAEVIPLVR